MLCQYLHPFKKNERENPKWDVVLQTEAPILIRPFLSLMTKSELHAIMVGGFATIAGGVLAAYIKFGVSFFFSPQVSSRLFA